MLWTMPTASDSCAVAMDLPDSICLSAVVVVEMTIHFEYSTMLAAVAFDCWTTNRSTGSFSCSVLIVAVS